MDTVKLEGNKRAGLGSKFARAVRREGNVPCVLYGQDGIQHFSIHPQAIKKAVYTPEFKIVEVSIDGKAHRSILKDIQFHPITDAIVHMDFLQLKDGVPVKVSLPLRTKGVAVGVKAGGKLIQQVRKILVKVLPEDLVEELHVDVTELKLGHSVRVRDIEVNSNMQIMNPAATPVAAVEIPRALRSAQAGAEKEGEDAAVAVAE